MIVMTKVILSIVSRLDEAGYNFSLKVEAGGALLLANGHRLEASGVLLLDGKEVDNDPDLIGRKMGLWK